MNLIILLFAQTIASVFHISPDNPPAALMESNRVVIVHFYDSSCENSLPVFEKIEEALSDSAGFGAINLEKHPEFAMPDITARPATVFVLAGQVRQLGFDIREKPIEETIKEVKSIAAPMAESLYMETTCD